MKYTEVLTVRKNLLSESLNQITELKKAEKDLRSVEKHTQTVTDKREGIDTVKDFRSANQFTQEITDKREEIDTEIDEVNVQVSNFCFCQCVFNILSYVKLLTAHPHTHTHTHAATTQNEMLNQTTNSCARHATTRRSRRRARNFLPPSNPSRGTSPESRDGSSICVFQLSAASNSTWLSPSG